MSYYISQPHRVPMSAPVSAMETGFAKARRMPEPDQLSESYWEFINA